jgi:hypothetical protein
LALRNVAASAERRAAEEAAAVVVRARGGAGEEGVVGEEGNAEVASDEAGAEKVAAAPVGVAPAVLTLGSLLALLEAELSGDPCFEPVRAVASKVLAAVGAGRGVTDQLDGSLVPMESAENEATCGLDEECLFEPLAPAASVGEALEYLVRSTQPRQARRAAAALRLLRAGVGFGSPL